MMRRRDFFHTSGAVGVATLPMFCGSAGAAEPNRDRGAALRDLDTVNTWHFFDLWRFDHLDQLELGQGRPQWQADAVYVDPPIGALSAWPTVYHDQSTGHWRMLYSADWKPYTLMAAESDDGRTWRPLRSQEFAGSRESNGLMPHQLFTLPGGSGGGVYRDPIAADGFPFKVFVHQRGEAVTKRAQANPSHRWHKVAKQSGSKRYLVDDFTLVSRDGVEWQPRLDMAWSRDGWHPEPPIFGFYNTYAGRHQMTVRPGWGDRRVCMQSTTDLKDWSGPELLLQPDTLDRELIELYGMPVFPYGDGYVGLLWVFHCESSEPTRGFNRFIGSLDCQLAYSYDGRRFFRGFRQPLVGCNPPGQPAGGAIQPSSMVEHDGELRIYSAASKLHHGKGSEAKRLGMTDNASIVLHTLRKDGLMLLRSLGDWGRLISKPMVLLSDKMSINLRAPHGELQYQLTDLESHPVAGFSFEDCLVAKSADQLHFPLQWNGASLKDVLGRIVRLEIRMRHAELFCIRGKMHFIDAQDRWMIEDGQGMGA